MGDIILENVLFVYKHKCSGFKGSGLGFVAGIEVVR